MKVSRLVSIIMLLLNCEKISATKLAEMFEVSPRTIFRDIEAIEQAGIPIFTTTGVEGGIGILPEYKVDKSLFTESDIQTLLMGLDSVSSAFPHKELVGTLEKVKNLIPKNQTVKGNQITVDLTTWLGNKTLLVSIEQIRKALAERKLLLFQYHDRTGNSSPRHVEPYQLVLKETHWYLHAYCLERQDFRVFKVIRMSDLSLDKTAYVPREFSPKPLDGSWIENTLIPIQLLVDASLYERMLELCGADHITPCEDGSYIAEFLFAPDNVGYNMLLSFGEKCECIAPDHIRSELMDRIKKLANRYNLNL